MYKLRAYRKATKLKATIAAPMAVFVVKNPDVLDTSSVRYGGKTFRQMTGDQQFGFLRALAFNKTTALKSGVSVRYGRANSSADQIRFADAFFAPHTIRVSVSLNRGGDFVITFVLNEDGNSGVKLRASQGRGIGAGALFIAADTGRMMFLKRSSKCESPGTWCAPGGGVEKGEDKLEGLRRELSEEIGFSDGRAQYKPICVIKSKDGFKFYNYLCIVPKEFAPTLNDEHTEHTWSNVLPAPAHTNFKKALTSPEMQAAIKEVQLAAGQRALGV